MIFRALAAFAIIVIIVGMVLLNRSDRATDATLAETRDRNPGYSARDAVIVETGDDGRPRYRLQAETITQAPDDLSISLDNLVMQYSGEDGTTWHATARSGVVPESRNRIDLEGSVRLHGTLGGTTLPAEVATERLSFDTEAEVADTSAPVTITWSGQRLAARGLRADLKAQTLELESSVHGRYAP